MKVCVFGCGYVGLTVSAGLAEIGHDVYCIDTNDYKINNIKNGIIDIYEPDLEEVVLKNLANNKLRLYTEFKNETDTDLYIIAVGTPQKDDGGADTKNVEKVITQILTSITKYTVIINKSTVPIGTALSLKNQFKNKTSIDFDIVSNPEFLSQGTALKNFLHPQRIIIGTKSATAMEKVKELYAPLNANIIEMDEQSAELTKYAANSFLAVKISYINQIANLANSINADISKIKEGLGADERIGKHFLNAGIGYGGSCLPKDTSELVRFAEKQKVELSIVNSARITNENQRRQFVATILKYYNYNIENKVFCLWGLAFKPNTNDLREAPSLTIANALIRYGAQVKAYDPKAIDKNLSQFKTKEEAIINSNALIIATEWDEFLNPNFEYIAKNLSDKIIFDARNIYINKDLRKYNLHYVCIGKSHD